MITGIQIRPARFALRMSAQQLAKAAGVSLLTIHVLSRWTGFLPAGRQSSPVLRKRWRLPGLNSSGRLRTGPAYVFDPARQVRASDSPLRCAVATAHVTRSLTPAELLPLRDKEPLPSARCSPLVICRRFPMRALDNAAGTSAAAMNACRKRAD